jgi:hypothetical protein
MAHIDPGKTNDYDTINLVGNVLQRIGLVNSALMAICAIVLLGAELLLLLLHLSYKLLNS